MTKGDGNMPIKKLVDLFFLTKNFWLSNIRVSRMLFLELLLWDSFGGHFLLS